MTMQETRVRPTFGYYRQANGWITVSPATALEELSYIREGWTPLPQYGRVEMTSEYMAGHPLEPLFMRGGAKELPIDQVLEMGFAMKPPVIPSCGRRLDQEHKLHNASCWVGAQSVTFPQLDGIDIGPFPCTVCAKDLSTPKAREQHEFVVHKEERGNARTGKALGEVIVAGLRSSTVPEQQEDKESLLEQIRALKRELEKAKRPIVRRAKRVARAG